MAPTLLRASSLKTQYSVLGHFYSLIAQGADSLPCRSVLEIRGEGGLEVHTADAVFVMMNPGSSAPRDENDDLGGLDRVSGMADVLVPTVPDTTQYQVMRIMHQMGWEYVRVINLSDLRDPKSVSFSKRYLELEKGTGCQAHSIFAPDRAAELRRYLLRKPDGPIICAWGVADKLQPLITRAMIALASASCVTGLAKLKRPGRYFHPLPLLQRDKDRWVVEMLEKLRT